MVKGLEGTAVIENNFALKTVNVQLVPAGAAGTATVSLGELEAMRDGAPVTASKHGLETICGASCETGAQ
jgi:hypothetical protein